MSEEQCEGLQAASSKGSIDEAKSIISSASLQGIDLLNQGLNSNGSHALIFSNAHLELTKYYVSIGADVNKCNKFGKTAVMYAAQGGHTPVVKYLVESKADIHAKDKDLVTALQYAVKGGKAESAIYLVSVGADPYYKKQFGLSAMDEAYAPALKASLVEAAETFKAQSPTPPLSILEAPSSSVPAIPHSSPAVSTFSSSTTVSAVTGVLHSTKVQKLSLEDEDEGYLEDRYYDGEEDAAMCVSSAVKEQATLDNLPVIASNSEGDQTAMDVQALFGAISAVRREIGDLKLEVREMRSLQEQSQEELRELLEALLRQQQALIRQG